MAETPTAKRIAPSAQEAEALYRRLLSMNPHDQAALLGLTQALRGQGRFGEAMALLESARSKLKLNKPLSLLYAESKLVSGDPISAERVFREILKEDPNLARAYIGLGRSQVAQLQLSEADSTFRIALRADPDSSDALSALSELALHRGELDAAVKLGHQAVDANPRHPLTQNAYGNALARTGHGDFAVQCFRNALELDPDFHPARLSLADLLLKRGEIEAAGQMFAQLIQAVPNWSPPRHGMARAAILGGRPDVSENLLKGLSNREPKRADLRLEWAQALLLQRKVDEAEALLRDTLTVLPGLLEAQMMLLDCARLRGTLAEAEAGYRQLIDQFPERSEPHFALCGMLEETADFAKLESAALAGLVLAPNASVLRLALSRSLLKRAAPEQALHELKLVDPNGLDVVRQIRYERTFGRTLEALHQPIEALKHYATARKLARENDATVAELDPSAIAAPSTQAASHGAGMVFLMGIPGSGIEVIGRVLKSLDATRVLDDRLGFDIRRQDIFADAVLTVRSPISELELDVERQRYEQERSKLQSAAGQLPDRDIAVGLESAMDWVPGSAQSLALINELFPAARVVLVERDPRDCLCEVLACGALVQTAPLEPLALAQALKNSHEGIKALKARLGVRLFSLNPNGFIDHPETSLAALNRFLASDLKVPDWLTEQRTGDPWGVLRPAGSFKSLEGAFAADVMAVFSE